MSDLEGKINYFRLKTGAHPRCTSDQAASKPTCTNLHLYLPEELKSIISKTITFKESFITSSDESTKK